MPRSRPRPGTGPPECQGEGGNDEARRFPEGRRSAAGPLAVRQQQQRNGRFPAHGPRPGGGSSGRKGGEGGDEQEGRFPWPAGRPPGRSRSGNSGNDGAGWYPAHGPRPGIGPPECGEMGGGGTAGTPPTPAGRVPGRRGERGEGGDEAGRLPGVAGRPPGACRPPGALPAARTDTPVDLGKVGVIPAGITPTFPRSTTRKAARTRGGAADHAAAAAPLTRTQPKAPPPQRTRPRAHSSLPISLHPGGPPPGRQARAGYPLGRRRLHPAPPTNRQPTGNTGEPPILVVAAPPLHRRAPAPGRQPGAGNQPSRRRRCSRTARGPPPDSATVRAAGLRRRCCFTHPDCEMPAVDNQARGTAHLVSPVLPLSFSKPVESALWPPGTGGPPLRQGQDHGAAAPRDGGGAGEPAPAGGRPADDPDRVTRRRRPGA